MLYPRGMPLSDHERKLLAEMEAAFEQDDPRLVSTLTGKARTRQASRTLLGLFLILGGILVLFLGLISKVIVIGLAGFVIALLGVFLVVTNFSLPTLAPKSKAKKPSWSERLERRWDRRNLN
jgi:ABC-type nickel/cobalt efflux system permease component RcnA